MRFRLILFLVIVLAVVYWRGVKSTTKDQGLDCQYSLGYAICDSDGKKIDMPGIVEILKAGAKF